MKKLFVGVLCVALSLSVQGKEVNMTSPDGKYQFTLSDKQTNRIQSEYYYSILIRQRN